MPAKLLRENVQWELIVLLSRRDLLPVVLDTSHPPMATPTSVIATFAPLVSTVPIHPPVCQSNARRATTAPWARRTTPSYVMKASSVQREAPPLTRVPLARTSHSLDRLLAQHALLALTVSQPAGFLLTAPKDDIVKKEPLKAMSTPALLGHITT